MTWPACACEGERGGEGGKGGRERERVYVCVSQAYPKASDDVVGVGIDVLVALSF
jgi:hypothetical protein